MIEFSEINKTRDVTNLFGLIGEAVCMIQLLEDALSHAITLKKDVQRLKRLSKEEANKYLENYRACTLGKAIRIIKNEELYSNTINNDLYDFFQERNWLIHKCVPYHIDDMLEVSGRDKLFQRVKVISRTAQSLRQIIEVDLIEFSEAKGLDMSKARVAVKKSYAVS